MKAQIMKYFQRGRQGLSRLIGVAVAILFFVLSAQAQTDSILEPIGGEGGSQFIARCPQGQLLTGFNLRTGDDVDSIHPICITAYGPVEVGALPPFEPIPYGPNLQLLCPRDAPIVAGMYVRAEGVTVIVNNIHLFCGVAASAQTLSAHPNAVFDGPDYAGSDFSGINYSSYKQSCPAGLVAVGISGRSGIWLDAVGLICGAPMLTARAPEPEYNSLGTVKPSTGAPLISICDSARAARARNSPAAPGLEAQCRAAGAAGESTPNALGKVKLPSTGAPPISICDSARGARERNSPAAPGLEAQCRAFLAAKGEAISKVDPIVAAGRTAEPDVSYQQGFDIATGIFGDPALGARGNTATGPGSLGIRDNLSAAGQRGFNASVTLHLSRNYKQTLVQSEATITANPNPVLVPNGQASGTTTITWKAAPDYTYSEIYLSVNNGQWSEFARGGDGTKPTTIELGSSYTFRMMVYEGQEGTPKIITTLTFTAQKI